MLPCCPSSTGTGTRVVIKRRINVAIGSASGTAYFNPTFSLHNVGGGPSDFAPLPFAYYSNVASSGTKNNSCGLEYTPNPDMAFVPDPWDVGCVDNPDYLKIREGIPIEDTSYRGQAVLDGMHLHIQIAEKWASHGVLRIYLYPYWGLYMSGSEIPGATYPPNNQFMMYEFPNTTELDLLLTHRSPLHNIPLGASETNPIGGHDISHSYPFMGIVSSYSFTEATYYPYICMVRYARIDSASNAGRMIIDATLQGTICPRGRDQVNLSTLTGGQPSGRRISSEGGVEWYLKNPIYSLPSGCNWNGYYCALRDWFLDYSDLLTPGQRESLFPDDPGMANIDADTFDYPLWMKLVMMRMSHQYRTHKDTLLIES